MKNGSNANKPTTTPSDAAARVVSNGERPSTASVHANSNPASTSRLGTRRKKQSNKTIASAQPKNKAEVITALAQP